MSLRLTPRKKGAFVLANLALGATYFIGGGSSGPDRTAYSVLDPLLTQQADALGCSNSECNNQGGTWICAYRPDYDCTTNGQFCSSASC
jgi:hypothetical protein